MLHSEIQRVYAVAHQLHDARKVWRQLRCTVIVAPRCAIERVMMRAMDLRGVVRGWAPRTTMLVAITDGHAG
jgi:hypothetical protein